MYSKCLLNGRATVTVLCACAHACVLTWKPKVDLVYPPPSFYLILLRQGLLRNLGFTDLARLADCEARGTFLSPLPQWWGYR